MSARLIQAAIRCLGAGTVAETWHRSVNLIYKWGNGNPRQVDQSPNTDPVQLMKNFLRTLAKNGGLKIAILICSEFLESIKEE